MRIPRNFATAALLAGIAVTSLAAPASGAVKSNGKTVKVRVKCVGQAGTTTPGSPADGVYNPPKPGSSTPGSGCNGRVTLKAKRKKLGSALFTLAPGQKKAVVVRLTRGGKRKLARSKKLKAKVRLKSSSAARAPRKLRVKLK